MDEGKPIIVFYVMSAISGILALIYLAASENYLKAFLSIGLIALSVYSIVGRGCCCLGITLFFFFIGLILSLWSAISPLKNEVNKKWSLMEKRKTNDWITMEFLERSYKCCGKNGAEDYTELELDIPIYCSKSTEDYINGEYIVSCLHRANQIHHHPITMWIKFLIELISTILLGIIIYQFNSEDDEDELSSIEVSRSRK